MFTGLQIATKWQVNDRLKYLLSISPAGRLPTFVSVSPFDALRCYFDTSIKADQFAHYIDNIHRYRGQSRQQPHQKPEGHV